jgi:hypothetical protein
MSGIGGVARIGCLTILAIVVSPLLLLIGVLGFGLLRDTTCLKVDQVPVRLQDTNYLLPAGLQPTFSPRFNGTKKGATIRAVWRSGKYAYCPGLGRRFVPQAGFMIERKSLNRWAVHGTEAYPEIDRVRIFGLSDGGSAPPPPLASDEVAGPSMFGRPTRYRCHTGYYGPGETCVAYGRAADGAVIRINLYPRGSQAQMFAAMSSVETIVTQLRAPSDGR